MKIKDREPMGLWEPWHLLLVVILALDFRLARKVIELGLNEQDNIGR